MAHSVPGLRTDIKCIRYGSNTQSDSSAVRGLAGRLGGGDFGTPERRPRRRPVPRLTSGWARGRESRPVCVVIAKLRAGDIAISEEERQWLAAFIALSMVRGPAARDHVEARVVKVGTRRPG